MLKGPSFLVSPSDYLSSGKLNVSAHYFEGGNVGLKGTHSTAGADEEQKAVVCTLGFGWLSVSAGIIWAGGLALLQHCSSACSSMPQISSRFFQTFCENMSWRMKTYAIYLWKRNDIHNDIYTFAGEECIWISGNEISPEISLQKAFFVFNIVFSEDAQLWS